MSASYGRAGPAVVALLVAAAATFGPLAVVAAYVGPYVVVNAWLVGYTWLQHTDVDVPHYADDEWSWLLGAFQTIDRPYGRLVDALHHPSGELGDQLVGGLGVAGDDPDARVGQHDASQGPEPRR